MISPALLAPSLQQAAVLAAVLAVLAALRALGALAAGHRRVEAGDVVVGWGIAAIVMTVAGTAFAGTLAAAGWGVLAAGLVAAVVLRGARPPVATLRILVLAAPLLLVAAAMAPSQWDEFSQWLHSVRYLLEQNGFPSRGGTPYPGSFAAYPFGNALPATLASYLGGQFLENAGALVNVAMAAVFGALLADLVADGLGRSKARSDWSIAAVGLVAATAANPTFVPKIVFTAYADTATALALAVVGIAGWRMLNGLAEDDRAGARGHAVQAALAGACLLSLKQANLVLFVLTLSGMALVAVRDPRLRSLLAAAHLVAVAVAALVPYVAWNWYVAREIPNAAAFAVKPFDAWAVDLVPTVLAGMAKVASNKGGHFSVLAALTMLSVPALVRMRSGFDRLVVVAATTAVGYNAFLVFAYIAAFERGEAEVVASYWRYNLHVGGIAWAAAVFGLAMLWRRWGWRMPAAGRVLPVLVLVLPLAGARYVRFDLHPPKLYVRAVASELVPLVPHGARVAIVDPLDQGFYGLLMKFLLHERTDSVLRMYHGQPPDRADAIAARLERFNPDMAWVHVPSEAIRTVFGLPLPPGSSHLLAKDAAGGWSVVRSWPYPGYTDPFAIPD